MLTFLPTNAWIIAPLLLVTIILASFFQSRKGKFIVTVLMTIFIVMELISIYFSGGFVDYQFYVNLNINDILEGLLIFKWQAALSVIVFLLLLFTLVWLATILQRRINVLIRIMIVVISIASMNYTHGPFDKLMEIYVVTRAPTLNFEQSLVNLHMNDYPTKVQLTSEQGKNIIVISLESFEQGFLADPTLTPYLNQLKSQYTFFDKMPMAIGSSWTASSMYTYMTGMPLLVGDISTMPLSGMTTTKLVNLGDVLHKAGYQTRYIIGGPQFAGIGHIISLFGIDIVSEQSYPNEYPQAPFGLYDKDAFAIAQRQVEGLSQSNKPFALFISTVSTHAPNGFYDERMEQNIAKQDDDMSFVAASLDYNLGHFIAFLDEKNLLENTVFYIFPDHLMMGAGTNTIAKLEQKPRSLYLLTNADPQALPVTTEQTIYQIDLPRLILDGAQINTNARFLTDYLGHGIDKISYLQENTSQIATLNYSAGNNFENKAENSTGNSAGSQIALEQTEQGSKDNSQ